MLIFLQFYNFPLTSIPYYKIWCTYFSLDFYKKIMPPTICNKHAHTLPFLHKSKERCDWGSHTCFSGLTFTRGRQLCELWHLQALDSTDGQVNRLLVWAPKTFSRLKTRRFSRKTLSLTFQSGKWNPRLVHSGSFLLKSISPPFCTHISWCKLFYSHPDIHWIFIF